jgi:hypothetical protein
VVSVRTDEEFQARLRPFAPTRAFRDDEKTQVGDAITALGEAHAALGGATSVLIDAQAQEETLHRLARRFGAIGRAWRAVVVVVAVLLVGVLAITYALAADAPLTDEQVTTAFADELTNETSVDCDAYPGREDAWRCAVGYNAAAGAVAEPAGTPPVVAPSMLAAAADERPARLLQAGENTPGSAGIAWWELVENEAEMAAIKVAASGSALEEGDPMPGLRVGTLNQGGIDDAGQRPHRNRDLREA